MIKVVHNPISAVSQSFWGTKGAFAGPKGQLNIDSTIGFLEDLFGFSLGRTERLVLFETLNRAASIKKENEAGALEQTLSLLTTLLDEAKADKLIRRDIHNDVIIAAVYGALSQLVRESFQKPRSVERADLREVLDIFWRGTK